MSKVTLILAILLSAACSPAPAEMADLSESAPAPASDVGTPPAAASPVLYLAAADPDLRAAAAWALPWWRDAGAPEEVILMAAGQACAAGESACATVAWRDLSALDDPRADGRLVYGHTSRLPDDTIAVDVDPVVGGRPPAYLRAVVAHELGHAQGFGHSPDREGPEMLMNPAPDIAGGALCVDDFDSVKGEQTCRDL